MAKERIDIERLLEWAYRAQCVDKAVGLVAPRGPAGAGSGIATVLALGTRVQGSSMAEQALGVRVPNDALTVHDAVLSLDEFWLEWRDEDEVVLWTREDARKAGKDIVQQGRQWALTECYIPGGTVAPLPVRLEYVGIAPLLITHARAGSRPETYPDWAAAVGRRNEDDLPVDRWGRSRKHLPGRDGLSHGEVFHARALYMVWRCALAVLAVELEGALVGYDVTGPEAQAEPWGASKKIHDGHSIAVENSA